MCSHIPSLPRCLWGVARGVLQTVLELREPSRTCQECQGALHETHGVGVPRGHPGAEGPSAEVPTRGVVVSVRERGRADPEDSGSPNQPVCPLRRAIRFVEQPE